MVGWLACLGWRKKPAGRKLLIIRVDEIGDYMLWRPFLPYYSKIPGYKQDILHFCGNQSWQSLFQSLDSSFVAESFWLDKRLFKKDMVYRYRFLHKIYRAGYQAVINPTFSRDKRYDDSIVKAARAGINMGMDANQESVQPYETGYDKGLYHQLFHYPEKPVFEFFRNRLFTEFLIKQTVPVANTGIDEHLLPAIPDRLPEKYFVVFPGSRSAARIWPAEHFTRVSNYLFETFGWTAVLAGTQNDASYIQDFLNNYQHPATNLQGKTTLPEMLSLLREAQCLLSVDTGSVHMAAAVGCTVFGIFNGSQYRRFAPYPKEIRNNFYAVYPDETEAELQDESIVKAKYEFVVKVPYSLVKAEKVILAIHEHFR